MHSLVQRQLERFLPSRQIRVFDSGFEFFILSFASLGLPICAFCAIFRIGPWSDHGAEWLQFICGVIFLNIAHNAFTYHALLFFPETRRWMRGKTANAKWFLWAQWSGIFILILIFFRFLVEIDGQADPLRLALWISAFVKFFPIHHGLKQISGISLIYNQKLKLAISDGQKTIKFMACERREKNLFFFLILSLVFAPLCSILFPGNLYASSCLPFLGGVFVFAIIWNSMRYPYVEKSNKTYFLMRLLFYPLSQYTFFGFFFIGATHGTEYLGVYHKMYMSSEVRGLRSLIALVILTSVVVILLVANPYQGLHWLLVQHFPSQIGVIKWLAAMTVSLTFMHYYLDRCLFKMREPIVRDNIGPLLLGSMPEGRQVRLHRLA